MADETTRAGLLRRGFALEYTTLAWNIVGIAVLTVAAISARSVALAGFGLDSLIEIGASAVVIWELSGTGEARQRHALRLIGAGFALLAAYLLAQSTWVLVVGYHPHHSPLGIGWTTATAALMFALAAGKAHAGAALDNPVLTTEGRVTRIDGAPSRCGSAWPDPQRRRRLVVGRPGRRLRARLLRSPRGNLDDPPDPLADETGHVSHLQVAEQREHTPADVVADRADVVERESGGIGQVPVEIALAGEDRARVPAAHRDDDVGCLHVPGRQRLGELRGDVQADLGHRLNDGRVQLAGRLGAGRGHPDPPGRLLVQQRSSHLGAARVVGADEQHLGDISHEMPQSPPPRGLGHAKQMPADAPSAPPLCWPPQHCDP
jgi:hypothetical protein